MIAGVLAGGRPFAAVGGGVPTAGLVAWFKMDSISGDVLTDETGVHTGTITNGSLVSGHLGSAIQFNGTSTLGSVPNNAALNCEAFTVSIWLKFTSSDNLVIAERNQNTGWSLQILNAGGASFYGGSAGQVSIVSNTTTNILRSGITVNDGAWHHIAATVHYAGGVSKMYVDGTLTSPTSGLGSSVAGGPSYISGPLSIGQRPTNVAPFNGDIDNFRYYDRALSAAEVLQLYNE